jgi:hypothetical protein
MVHPQTGRYLSLDYGFCHRWRAFGGKVWVDLECKPMYLGQRLFRGDLAASLRVQAGGEVCSPDRANAQCLVRRPPSP